MRRWRWTKAVSFAGRQGPAPLLTFFLRYVDHRSRLPYRTKCLLLAERSTCLTGLTFVRTVICRNSARFSRRAKFLSVTAWHVRRSLQSPSMGCSCGSPMPKYGSAYFSYGFARSFTPHRSRFDMNCLANLACAGTLWYNAQSWRVLQYRRKF